MNFTCVVKRFENEGILSESKRSVCCGFQNKNEISMDACAVEVLIRMEHCLVDNCIC